MSETAMDLESDELKLLHPVTPDRRSSIFTLPLLTAESTRFPSYAEEFLRDIYAAHEMKAGLRLTTTLRHLKALHDDHRRFSTQQSFLHRSVDPKRFLLIFGDMSVAVGTLTSRGLASPLPFALHFNNPVHLRNSLMGPATISFRIDDSKNYSASRKSLPDDYDGVSELRWRLEGSRGREQDLISHRGKPVSKTAEGFIQALHQEAEEWISANPPIRLNPETLWPAVLSTRATPAHIEQEVKAWMRRCLFAVLHFAPDIDFAFGGLRDRSDNGDGSDIVMKLHSNSERPLPKYFRRIKLQRSLFEHFKSLKLVANPSDLRRLRAFPPGESFDGHRMVSLGSALLKRSDIATELTIDEQEKALRELGPIIEPLRIRH